ncbi:MAG: transposase [Muribaculaceae bacterium]|nr:transposase [Muribaculaceae bacterium]
MFLDKKQHIQKSAGGNLPHWHQDETIQFVTFRVADSLPQDVLIELNRASEKFKQQHQLPWDLNTKRKYREIISLAEEKLLDNGYGSCPFKSDKTRKILRESIFYNDGKDYEIIAYVIMPNHVHLLIQLFDDNKLDDILRSIKGYTARKINKLYNRTGKFWMRESFDRIVRNVNELLQYIEYIEMNPKFLPDGEYELYISNVNF